MTELNAMALPAGAVRRIEDLAVRAWPARLVQPLHGWRLAFGDGLTRRINSVQAVAWDDRAPLDEAVEQVERFYAGRALPARFRITAVSRPRDLDACLAARGYEVEAPTDVLVANAGPMRRGSTGPPVTTAPTPPPDWEKCWLASGAQGEAAKRRALLARLPEGTVFALARIQEEPVGIGLAVIEREWAGIFSMQTAAPYRGRGVARAVLDALIARAAAAGANRLYLQVEQDNAVAQRLYRRAGFSFAYGYHYRSRCTVGAEPSISVNREPGNRASAKPG